MHWGAWGGTAAWGAAAGHGFGFVWGLFWIIMLIVLVTFLVRRYNMRTYRAPFFQPGEPLVQPSALEILRQRYARGEIDATTFDQMRERLGAEGPGQR